jgi:hypothetical protein
MELNVPRRSVARINLLECNLKDTLRGVRDIRLFVWTL